MRRSVKARASGPLASQLPALTGGSIPAAAAHCHGWPLPIDAEAWLAPYEGHQVVEALTAGKKTLESLHLQDHLSSSSADGKNTVYRWSDGPMFSLAPCGDML